MYRHRDQDHPHRKEMQKSKMAVGGVGHLQPAVKRREAQSKGEKERYTHLNAEFQRIARKDKKAFLSDQGKEIEKNNRMGKTRDLVKKIRYTKGTFHAKMGSIKDRNGKNLTEAEDIKKRWREYSFILLQVVDQFSQHHLLKRLSLIHCIFLPPLSKIRCP